ncbi:MAG: sugar phosphate nucleotidyltransferase [Candidatus Kapabacteria bacterium]|jgi:mannose-1-phosphate guanylyltransferase|nr:sugar phosphate nucleotidyltransferase [Candidatus Kapabacteria bacterium]
MTKKKTKDFKKAALIMAGGTATALWPRSTKDNPKLLTYILGEGSMIQNTVVRLLPYFDLSDIYIVTNDRIKEQVIEQLPAIAEENIISEPFGRGTAPCVALAVTYISEKYDDDSVIMAFPSDHYIENVREFHDSLILAADVAYNKKGIVTLGINPSRPETEYGYIQVKDKSFKPEEVIDENVRYSTTFAEKPDSATAQRFMDSGDFVWNSGIFVWRKDVILNAFKKYLPEHYRFFKILKKQVGKDFFKETLKDIYYQIDNDSLDYAILEKADNVFVVRSTFTWSDLGSWDEIHRIVFKDARNNYVEGNVAAVNIHNCLISSHDRFIGIAGVKDLVIIDSEDSLLVCRRDHEEDVQDIIDYMKRKQITHYM